MKGLKSKKNKGYKTIWDILENEKCDRVIL